MTEIKKKIIVADDEQKILNILSIKLRLSGYEVIVASNGEEALEQVRAARPDIMLLDIIMPGLDGFEVLRRLRNDPVTDRIPVIMLTSKRETQSIFNSRDLKATDYIVKPFRLNEVSELISRYLDETKRRPANI